MKNCVAVSFLILILVPVTPINRGFQFLKNINIWDCESIPIVFYIDPQSPRYDFSFNEMAFFMSVTNNTKEALCDKGLRNGSGILLLSPTSLDHAVQLLTQMNEMEPQCDYVGFYPTIFLILDTTNVTGGLSYSPLSEEVDIKLSIMAQRWNYSADSDVYLVIPSGQILQMRILEIYRIKDQMVIQEVEMEDEYNGFTTEGLSSRNRRLNFYGKMIQPIIFKIPTGNRFNDSIEMVYDVLGDMGVIMNFSYSMVYGDSWIHFDKNGSPQGIGKLLDNSEGDIIVQFLELSLERQAKFDFLYPNFNFRHVVFFRQPTTMYPNLIFQPYAVGAWIAYMVSYIALSLCIGFVAASADTLTRPLSQNSIPFKVFSLFTQQGWPEKVDALLEYTFSMKMTIVAGLILSSFFYNLYSASIIAIISFRDPPIKNMEQLMTSGVKLLVDSDARNSYRYIDKLTNDEKREVLKLTEDGVSALLNNSFVAFISTPHYIFRSQSVRILSLEKFCETVSQIELERKGLPIYSGMYVKKHSPFRKLFLYSNIRRAEVGSIDRQIRRYLKLTSPKCVNKKGDVESLNIEVVYPVYVLSLCIAMMSIVVLLFEVMFGYLSKYHQN